MVSAARKSPRWRALSKVESVFHRWLTPAPGCVVVVYLAKLSMLANWRHTIPKLLERAASEGIAVRVWFAGLQGVELHLQRVRLRVARGGHDIPRDKILERYDAARTNLIHFLPHLASVRVFDNSAEGAQGQGLTPAPRLLLHCVARKIVAPTKLGTLLANTPKWAKAITAAALDLHLKRR